MEGKNTFGLSASGNMTDHYLNPVVPENYTNNGTTGSFSLSYERDLTPKDRLTLIVRHELARYANPQRTGAAERSICAERGQHRRLSTRSPAARSPATACSFPGGSYRLATILKPWGASPTSTFFPPTRSACCAEWPATTPTDFYSNPASWPLIATQHNDFKEIYFNGSVSVHHGRQEFKAGVESDTIFLHENTSYVMPDCADPARPAMPYQSGDLRLWRDNLCLYRAAVPISNKRPMFRI